MVAKNGQQDLPAQLPFPDRPSSCESPDTMRRMLLVLLLASGSLGLKVESKEDDDGVDRLGQVRVKPMGSVPHRLKRRRLSHSRARTDSCLVCGAPAAERTSPRR